jgi:phospholipid-binding lipoprotein MlaA
MVPHTKYHVAIKTYDRVNETSLRIGDYEDLKKAALDPYVAFRDAYFQHRRNAIQH